MCRSTSATFPKVCKLNADDWKAIEKLDRLLERDLWIEETVRALRRFDPPAEVLPLTQNPSKKELEADRLKYAMTRTMFQAIQDGDGVDAGAGRCGWALLA